MYTFFMFLNYGISALANVYMQPLKCGNSDISSCHTENRAYGFLECDFSRPSVLFVFVTKFGLILIGASDKANMSTSSNNVTI